jgi:hypothetical protein
MLVEVPLDPLCSADLTDSSLTGGGSSSPASTVIILNKFSPGGGRWVVIGLEVRRVKVL